MSIVKCKSYLICLLKPILCIHFLCYKKGTMLATIPIMQLYLIFIQSFTKLKYAITKSLTNKHKSDNAHTIKKQSLMTRYNVEKDKDAENILFIYSE